jgi:hypothetical protein
MVIAHNPAGLVELRGSQFLFNLNLALFDACVEPQGFYGWGVYGGGQAAELPDPKTGKPVPLQLGAVDASGATPKAVEDAYYRGAYDTVCLDQHMTPIPQIAWTRRVSHDFGIGVGLIFPSAQPSGSWGGKYGVIRNAQGELRPAATRYMGLDTNTIGIFPNVAAAYRISDMLRVGLAFEWGIFGINTKTMASAVGGTKPTTDLPAHVRAQDFFVPALTASVHVVPIDAVDVVAAFRYQDDLLAHGYINLTTGVFDPQYDRKYNRDLVIKSLHQAMPWKARLGVRYADRLAPRAAGSGSDEADDASTDVIHDPLQDERWDIELDGEYQFNSRVDKQKIVYGPTCAMDCVGGKPMGILEFVPSSGASMPATVEFPAPTMDGPQPTVIEKYWKDQISVRLGGTYNVVPGKFGISAGTHYETRGVTPDYMQTDFWPVSRLGLHTGVIVRVAKSIDFVFSYGHIFQETIVVAAPPHQDATTISNCFAPPEGTAPTGCMADPGTLGSIDKTVGAPVDRSGAGTEVLEGKSQGKPDGTAKLDQNLNRVTNGQPPWIVNAGRYSSNFDIIAAGVNVHF